MDFASLDIREKLDRLQLPQGADKPVLLGSILRWIPILRVGLYGKESLVALRLVAEEQIKPELESLEDYVPFGQRRIGRRNPCVH